MSTGLIQIYTGNGKGKTTAALGLAVRARAVGKRVAIVFFDKGGEHYSERKLLGQLGVDWFGYGLDRIDPKTERFRFGVIPDDVAQAQRGITKAKELLLTRSGGLQTSTDRGDLKVAATSEMPYYDLLILDEINTTVALGMIPESAVEELIDAKPASTELVLTGRTEVAHGKVVRPSYFDRADLVTEMRLVKHYFYQGTPAREGLDY